MKYVCVKCGIRWVCGKSSEGLSGGLCNECIGEYIREKQRKRGKDDCFMREAEICSETDCNYWSNCNSRFLKGEK